MTRDGLAVLVLKEQSRGGRGAARALRVADLVRVTGQEGA